MSATRILSPAGAVPVASGCPLAVDRAVLFLPHYLRLTPNAVAAQAFPTSHFLTHYRAGTSIGLQLRRPDDMHSSALRASIIALASQMPPPTSSTKATSEHDVREFAVAPSSSSGVGLDGAFMVLF